jgi:ParB-like chromosome segregation protein Spo0J
VNKPVGPIKAAAWPADHVERRSVESLIPYARNARTHSDEQVAQIAASIKEWGWTTPVLVDEDGQIIAGHGRVMAARKLGIEDIPVMVARGWSEAQRRAYVLADNKLALNSGWDMDLLKVELQDIGEMSFDLDKIGFGVGEMTNLFLDVENGEVNPDEEWKGMPEFDQQDKNSFRHIVVHFETQSDVDEFARLIGQNLTDKTRSIWHPRQIEMDTESKRYDDEN